MTVTGLRGPRQSGNHRLKSDTRLLLASRFFVSAAQSLASIGMPVALLSAGAGLGLIGTLLAVATAVRVTETILVGMLADRGILRPFFVMFPFLALVGSLAFFATDSIYAMAIGTVLAGFGGGSGANSAATAAYKPAEYGWVVRNYADDLRNKVVSNFSAASVAGVVLASLLALGSRTIGADFHLGTTASDQARLLMEAVAVFSLFPAVMGSQVRRMPKPPPRLSNPDRGVFQRWSRKVLPGSSRKLMRQLSIIGIFNGMANGSFGSFIVLWLVLRFHASPVELGLINLVIASTAFFGDLACSVIARSLGLVRSVFVTRVIQALVIVPLTFTPTLLAASLLLLVRQFAQRLNQPLRDSYVLARARPHEKARISAMSNVSSQSVQALSSQATGQIVAETGFAPPFIAAALFQLIGGVLFFKFYANEPPPEEMTQETRSQLGFSAHDRLTEGIA